MMDYKVMTEKNILKPLQDYAFRTHKDPIIVWNDWLEWLCLSLDFSKVREYDGYPNMLLHAKNDNELFFEAMANWFNYATDKARENGGAFDSFGHLYEENFQSGYKASKSGQFFTPESLCMSMANCIGFPDALTDEVIIAEDSACGSGRTLIQYHVKAGPSYRLVFSASDVDITSVRMCALNMYISGMVGRVSQMDALSGDWHCGYIVNACKVPSYNVCPSLEYFDKQEIFECRWDTLKDLAKEWDIIKLRKS